MGTSDVLLWNLFDAQESGLSSIFVISAGNYNTFNIDKPFDAFFRLSGKNPEFWKAGEREQGSRRCFTPQIK